MKQPKIAIAGFMHETNTFSPLPTTFENFEHPGAFPRLARGQAVIDKLAELNVATGGFISESDDFELLPILWTFAEPGGYIEEDAFERLSAMITDAIGAADDLDGIFLDLHGAMVTRKFDDGEAEVLSRIREIVGPDLPMAISLDLHANLSPAVAEYASSMTIYRTYPHVDMAQTGARARKLLRQELQRGEPFAKAFRQPDFLIPLHTQSTRRDPGQGLYERLPAFCSGAVLSVDMATGFPLADIPDCGPSVFACGTDQAEVNQAAESMITMLNEAREQFQQPLISARDAVNQAKKVSATKPVIIADVQDNPGAGGTGDTTGLLEALVRGGAQNAIIGMIWDAKTAMLAHDAGVGSELEVKIGGGFPQLGDKPFVAKIWVEALSEGDFTFTGPMMGGGVANIGKMAALRIIDHASDVVVVVGSNRVQNLDQAIFTNLGFDPSDYAIVCVKSTIHFLADYEPIAEKVILAESPGANPCQLDTVAFTRLRHGLFN